MKLAWHNDTAKLPDGTEYGLFSEHVRGEPRFWWPEVRKPDWFERRGLHNGWQRIDCGYDYTGTKAAAKRVAQRHADQHEPEEDRCVFCGEKDVEFVDGLRCRACAEEQDGD